MPDWQRYHKNTRSESWYLTFRCQQHCQCMEKIVSTVEELERVLLVAFGPCGQAVLVQQPTGQFTITRSGLDILTAHFPSPQKDPYLCILLDCVRTLHKDLGDGVKCFIFMLAALLRKVRAVHGASFIARELTLLQLKISILFKSSIKIDHLCGDSDADNKESFDDMYIQCEVNRVIQEHKATKKESKDNILGILLLTSAVLPDLSVFCLGREGVSIVQGIPFEEMSYIHSILMTLQHSSDTDCLVLAVKSETVEKQHHNVASVLRCIYEAFHDVNSELIESLVQMFLAIPQKLPPHVEPVTRSADTIYLEPLSLRLMIVQHVLGAAATIVGLSEPRQQKASERVRLNESIPGCTCMRCVRMTVQTPDGARHSYRDMLRRGDVFSLFFHFFLCLFIARLLLLPDYIRSSRVPQTVMSSSAAMYSSYVHSGANLCQVSLLHGRVKVRGADEGAVDKPGCGSV
uniref:Uncharacterized protein n=1 Tax=Timema cristinae TaxID=61476 RepID=A0A7R9CAG8_TIMCR|nr:unnamed protein product [Timema cristinae]